MLLFSTNEWAQIRLGRRRATIVVGASARTSKKRDGRLASCRVGNAFFGTVAMEVGIGD